jgi:hypothetical protein
MVEQSNPGGNRLRSIDLVAVFCFCFVCAELAAFAENPPKPSSARETPARSIDRPIKTRTLKNADLEVDVFFMVLGGLTEELGFSLREKPLRATG